jgi:hypothetical protein
MVIESPTQATCSGFAASTVISEVSIIMIMGCTCTLYRFSRAAPLLKRNFVNPKADSPESGGSLTR